MKPLVCRCRALLSMSAIALGCACTTLQAQTAGEWAPNPPNPKAPYPAESKTFGEQGTVLLRVRTTPDGKPMTVEVKQSSGYVRLDRSATETVSKWQFKPTPDDGTVVWREVPISFFIVSQPPSSTLN